MPGKLFPVGGGAPITLAKREMVVGRAESTDIHIFDPAVSSRHCMLKFNGVNWVVVDLHSKNGTKVNEEPVTQQRQLRSGDMISVARKHRYRIEYNPAQEKERFDRMDSEEINVIHGHHLSNAMGPETTVLPAHNADDDHWVG